MTYYSLELANLKEEKPELLKVLKDGAFAIYRTGRRVGIDMALEQTINAEAKSRLKGVVAFADISTAVNRWIVTGSMRSQIVNSLLEVADLKSYNSDNKELNKPRMERDKKDLEKIKEYICSTTNPFQKGVQKDVLFNLKTGKQASSNTEHYLLNILSDGEEKRNDFVSDCAKDSSRFEKPIKRSKVINFAAENFQKKNISKKAAAIAQTKGTRDMFGRLLFLSIQRQINIKSVFQYPLLPEPVCFAHPDGFIRDSPKSKVFHFLKTKVTSTPPTTVKTVIVHTKGLHRKMQDVSSFSEAYTSRFSEVNFLQSRYLF